MDIRDGAAAQYGSDAIAGVVNVVIKEGSFSPFLRADLGRHRSPGGLDQPRRGLRTPPAPQL